MGWVFGIQCPVDVVSFYKDQIPFADMVGSVFNKVVPLPLQKVINFIGVMVMIFLHHGGVANPSPPNGEGFSCRFKQVLLGEHRITSLLFYYKANKLKTKNVENI